MKHLNKEQYEAATSINGPLLIIAGAGSGKTMTLVSRIANMIDEGIEPTSILLLTFTNKAAKEMKDRVAKNIGEKADGVTASTFHSFCAAFLRKYAHFVSIENNFSVIDGSDAAEAMGIVKDEFVTTRKELGITYNAKDFPDKKALISIYSYCINNGVDLKEFVLNGKYEIYYNEIKTILIQYDAYKKEHSLLDYDDLLLYTKKVLSENEGIRYSTGEKYKFVCADEYQDTNFLQDDILNLICKDHKNLAVVGDENQSIYKFRGAQIENILTFSKRYPDCKTIILNENYRSSQEILDLSNAVMEYATEGTKKYLHGQFNGNKPFLIITDNDAKENIEIIRRIKKFRSEGIPLKEMAVIVRNSSQTYNLETMLNQNGIPYNKFGGLKFLEKSVVRDILSFLRVLVNEKDEIALYRILQLYPGIGKGYSGKITTAVSNEGVSVLSTLYPKTAFRKYLLELVDVINHLKDKSVGAQLRYLLEVYYPQTVERSISLSKMSEGNKLEAKKKLFNDVKDAKNLYVLAETHTSTTKFLEDLVLEAATLKSDGDFLNITTIHSAKGLEYDVVFLMDVVNDITPRCEEGDDEDPEELRCLYVALTRARKELFLFAPRSHYSPPAILYQCELSHFLNYESVIDCTTHNPSDVASIKETYESTIA